MTERVFIGLPVHNGEQYLAASLETLVSQGHSNLQILIRDNGSTDGSKHIAELYARQDSRIKVESSPENRGAIENFNSILRSASGDYLMFASDHDLHDPDFVGSALAALKSNPGAVLAFTGVREIDESGETVGIKREVADTTGIPTMHRPGFLLRNGGLLTCIYGLFRTEAIKEIRWRRTYGPDTCFLMELCMKGTFVEVPEPLLLYRVFKQGPKNSYASVGNWREYIRYHLNSLEPGMGDHGSIARFPTLSVLRNLLRVTLPQASLAHRPALAASVISGWAHRWKFQFAEELGLGPVLKKIDERRGSVG